MALHEICGLVKVPESSEIVFVIDASESAAAHQREIVTLTRQVMSQLPARVKFILYFLGNPLTYESSQFDRRVSMWLEENRQRASLITPIYEALSDAGGFTVVVIGSGRIYDLEDWAKSSLLRHTVLVSLGDSLRGDLSLAEEILNPTADRVCQKVYDPVTTVRITGSGFMPTWWDNDAYRLEIANGKVTLIGERLKDYSITLTFFTASETGGEATITRASGTEDVVPVQAPESKVQLASQESQLRGDEVEILQKAVQKERFVCIHCGREHTWNTLHCRQGAIILGELVYPSLQQHNASGFVLFNINESCSSFEIHPCDVLRLGVGVAAIKEGRQARVYCFDDQDEVWTKTSEVLEPYQQVEEGKYAILI